MYFTQHLPWWLLFILINAVTLGIGLLDVSISNLSILYIVVINSIIMVLFAIWQYASGRHYEKELMKMNDIEDIESLPVPTTRYQRALQERLLRVRQSHNDRMDQESMKTKENMDEMTRWIHDMKMPMTTLKLLMDDVDGQRRVKLLNEWQRLEGMLNEMLYMKRLPNIQNDLYIETAELGPIIGRSIQKLRTLCMEKDIGFDITLSAPEVKTDVKWLSFILDQIITNSVKYTEDDEIEISSSMVDGAVSLTVEDHGRGIRPEDLPRIFESGFTSTSNHGDGQSTGMGLYLANQAAEAMHLDIDVQSEYGNGTKTTLTFAQQNAYHKVKTM
ncbi:sensor histidine kinase [Salinicoccus sp. ID82-1]|uniref:sensor histidine kinase n=1 Tax=Salinicoccus sp. ID82-1 TaxID=2820269 RepID=UPI001F1EA2CA|nr:sensor histidine kinase [Salinicoccus sp. ID82-1]MCG1009784.1 sensor histidine kinase [Salinicoccus sp. ID82-1]